MCRARNANNARADFHLGMVTEKLRHGSTFTNIVFKSVDKLLFVLHTVYLCNKGLSTNKDLSRCLTSINGRGVGEDGIRSDGFITTFHIECREKGDL